MLWDAFHSLFEASACWSKTGNTPTHIKYQPIAPTFLDHQHVTLKNQQHVQARQGVIFFKMCGLRSSALLWSCGWPRIWGLYLAHWGHYSSLSPSFSSNIRCLTHTENAMFVCVPFFVLSFRCCVWFECVLLKMQQLEIQHDSLFQPQPTSRFFSLFLSVSLLFIFHSDNIMKTRLKYEPSESG